MGLASRRRSPWNSGMRVEPRSCIGEIDVPDVRNHDCSFGYLVSLIDVILGSAACNTWPERKPKENLAWMSRRTH